MRLAIWCCIYIYTYVCIVSSDYLSSVLLSPHKTSTCLLITFIIQEEETRWLFQTYTTYINIIISIYINVAFQKPIIFLLLPDCLQVNAMRSIVQTNPCCQVSHSPAVEIVASPPGHMIKNPFKPGMAGRCSLSGKQLTHVDNVDTLVST